MAHTPGPWQAVRDRSSQMVDVRRDEKGPNIANVYHCGANAMDNARLIAAAPELLEAALLIAEQAGKTRHKPIGSPSFEAGVVAWEAVEKLRDAVAKATGTK